MIDPEVIDKASDAELRAMFKAMVIEQQGRPEPVGLDKYSHLPIFLEPPECPRCLPFAEMQYDRIKKIYAPICHDCKNLIPWIGEFGGRGIESVTVDHLHTHEIQRAFSSASVRIPVHRELCLPCFRIDWAKANPNKPCDL